MTTATRPFKSRWGFHPCSYEVYLKLKRLYKWYWQTLYDFHRWHRWRRKQEQNRTGAEPSYCPVFVLDQPWYKPARLGGQDGFKVYPKTVTDHGVVELYRSARVPQSEPAGPLDADTLRKIDQLYWEVAPHWAK